MEFINREQRKKNDIFKGSRQHATIALIEGNGHKTRQSSLLYVFVRYFGLEPAQNRLVVYSILRY